MSGAGPLMAEHRARQGRRTKVAERNDDAGVSEVLDDKQFEALLADMAAKENLSVNEDMDGFSHTFVDSEMEARFNAFFDDTFHRRLLAMCGVWTVVCVAGVLRGYVFGIERAEAAVLTHAGALVSLVATLALYHWHSARMRVVRTLVSRDWLVVAAGVVMVVIAFGGVEFTEIPCSADDAPCQKERAFASGYLAGVLFVGLATLFMIAIPSFLHLLLLASVLPVAFVGVLVGAFGHTVRPASVLAMACVYLSVLWAHRSNGRLLRRQFLHALGTVRLTQQYLARLSNAKEHKQRVVGYLFHEVRNPINDIVLASALALGTVSRLKEATPQPTPPQHNSQTDLKQSDNQASEADGGMGSGDVVELEKLLQVVSQSGTAASHVLDDALDLQKLEAGHFAFVKDTFGFGELYGPVVASLEPRFARKGVKLSVSCCSQLHSVTVEADLKRLRQVLHNFLSNALKFTPADGQVVVSVALRAHRTNDEGDECVLVRTAVSDTGIGLSKADQAKMFTPWSQIRAAQTQAGGGTGLGLALSKDFVEVGHNGEIGCKSPGDLGSGSTFFFEVLFPLRHKSPSQARQEVGRVERRAREGSGGVLIVDDSAVTRRLMGRLLRTLGVSFDECENGKDAVEKVRANDFALVLMDKEMPVMDGFEATRQIRTFNASVPVVGVTGNAMDFQQQEFLGCGVDRVVAKPIGKEGLESLLEAFGVV